MTKWPETVPVLTKADICKGDFNGPYGSHCLIGWCSEVFPGFNPNSMCLGDALPTVDAALKKVISRYGHGLVVEFNDSPTIKESTIARVWNSAMRSLGYTEIIDA